MDKKRLLFVDTFKVIIILLMIQGHLLRALLAPPYYAGSRWFPLHEFLHGIVAPGFLFLSGFLFAYTLVEKPKSPDLFFNKISSAFGLFAVNAFLHLPYFSYRKISLLWERGAGQNLLQMDVLATIGFSILTATVFFFLFPKRWFWWSVGGILLVNFLFWLFPPTGFLHPLFGTFVSPVLSPFPFFPWSFYFFLGILASRFLRKFSLWTLAAALVLMALSVYFPEAKWDRVGDIGKVLFLYGLCQRFGARAPGSFKPLSLASQESLSLYGSHLMIVYGSVFNKGLVYWWGSSVTPVTLFCILIALYLFVYTASFWIFRLRKASPPLFVLCKNLFFLTVLYGLATRPW